MDEHLYNSYDNPLEAVADELSRSLNSTSVDLNETSTGIVEAGQVTMRHSAARSVRANALHMEESAAALVSVQSVDAHESALGAVVARDAVLEDVTTPLIVAQNVRADEVQTFALIAAHVEGNVRALLTPLTAVAMGVGFAATLLLGKALLPKLLTPSKR